MIKKKDRCYTMKKILICFLALSSMGFAQMIWNKPPQKENLAQTSAKEKPKALDNYDNQNALQPDNGKYECEPQCCPAPCYWTKYFSLAFKPSFFWPQGDNYKHIYGEGFCPLVETTYTIYKWFNVFLEAGYYHKNSDVKSVNLYAHCDVTTIPVSFGLNYTYRPTSYIDLYLKIGPNWVYTKTGVDIPGLKKVVKKNTFGGTFGAGAKFYLSHKCFLELFANYLYDEKEIYDQDANEKFHRQLGGIQAGIGLGIRL
jgi:hypothetical protein